MKIPWYVFKPLEELARAVLVGIGAYLVTAVATNGLPTTQEAVIALAVGAVPFAVAAVRAFLNKTPLTPPTAPVVLDNPVVVTTDSGQSPPGVAGAVPREPPQ